ncbi:MAG TPA: PAS domain-containing protein [Streptosporangiaceae bacterium]|nr:PAS domain-containing protein [Streptosporangiaceae bacterium]
MEVATWQFGDPGLLDALESGPVDRIDDLDFGLIVMARDGAVTGYNQAESKLSGLPVDEVVGRNFFIEVGPCTNNYLIAQRYQDCAAPDGAAPDGDLDEQLDYVFTYRMSPTPVRLRLMARRGSARQYLAVQLR